MCKQTLLVATAAVVAILCHLLPPVAAHAVLMKPKSRNQLALESGSEKCSWCSQSGGPPAIGKRGGGWPSINYPKAHGLCGDPHQTDKNKETFKGATYMKQGSIQATYVAGDVVEFEVGINTWHQGHYEFRICETGIHDGIESPEAGQKCLNKWVLKRAPTKPGCSVNSNDFDCQPVDPDHPERWMQSPQNANMVGTKYDGTKPVDWSKYNGTGLWLAQEHSDRTQTINRIEKMRYIIPEGLSCEKCTLQWYWSSGNNCHYDAGDQTILKRMGDAGWNIGQWSYIGPNGRVCSDSSFGEEFWNCADIAVKPNTGNPAPSPPGPSSRRRSTRRRRRSSRRRSSSRRRRRRSSRRRSTRRRSKRRRR